MEIEPLDRSVERYATGEQPALAVIVPAHNEERCIARCIEALLGEAPGDGRCAEVVVVCNGCSDRTAEIARAFGPPVRVVEIGTASKPAALNSGDDHSTIFPRFYVDADVEVSLADLRSVAAAMEQEGFLAGSVRPLLHLVGASPVVRSYYRVWQALPRVRNGLTGAGVYGMSATGRRRFGRFPDLIGDDAFVDSLFDDYERLRLSSAFSVVRPAQTMAELLQTRVRVHVGNLQVARAGGPRTSVGLRGGSARTGWVLAVLGRPRLAIDLPVYLGVNAWSKAQAHRRLRAGSFGWATTDRGT